MIREQTAVCNYSANCTGCSNWGTPYQKQTQDKIAHLQNLFYNHELSAHPAQLISVGTQQLRQRVDFTLQKDLGMGFYDHSKNLLNISECLQLSPELQSVYSEFRTIDFSINKGSVRLRVGPQKQKGCWLDFANLDIKNLLTDGTSFKKLLSLGYHIEVGQKGKTVRLAGDKLILTEPEPQNWFLTIDQNLKMVPLKCLVSGFTQPSWISANEISKIILKWITQFELVNKKAIEFGCGIGQFTIPLLSSGMSVEVFESNRQLLDYLTENTKSFQLGVNHGDFQNNLANIPKKINLALVNPPRSGLKNFSEQVVKAEAQYCIYVSCFPETMTKDLVVFKKAGYQIQEAFIVDQFPQTDHYESCILLKKIT